MMKRTNIWITVKQHRQLHKLSKERPKKLSRSSKTRGTPASELIRLAIDEFLKKQK